MMEHVLPHYEEYCILLKVQYVEEQKLPERPRTQSYIYQMKTQEIIINTYVGLKGFAEDRDK